MMQGKELNKVFNQYDIAFSVFGLYKQDCNYLSANKTMDYLAREMPVVSRCIESAFNNKRAFFFRNFLIINVV